MGCLIKESHSYIINIFITQCRFILYVFMFYYFKDHRTHKI